MKFRLPPLLASDLAASKSQSHAFFLLLAWIDEQEHIEFELDQDKHRRLLGTLTALNWFAERPSDCIKTLWACRNELFSEGSLAGLLLLRDNRVQFSPLPPPSVFEEALNSTVGGARGNRSIHRGSLERTSMV